MTKFMLRSFICRIDLTRWRGRDAALCCGFAAVMALATGAGRAIAQDQSHLAQPIDLRCAGWNEPLAVADAHPEFSWKLAASSISLHGVKQTAYRIQVTEHEFNSAREILWDSGVVESAANFGVDYAGTALQPGRDYLWRVEVWDELKHASGWSGVAHWRQAPEWHAGWIAAPADNAGDDNEPMPLFRKTFLILHRATRAVLYASGLGQDELRLNGNKVGNDELMPGWSDYRKTVYYDTYDVTAQLHKGKNALGVILGNGMYRVLKTPGRFTKFVGSFGQPKLSLQLEIEFADGSRMDVVSDGTWKTAPGPITFSSTYGGEDYDARLEPRGWDRTDFDESAWHNVSVVDAPGGEMRPEVAPPIRAMHTYEPLKVTHPKPGVTIYDLGQNFAGWPEIAVMGCAGATVKLIPAELLDKDGLAWQRSSGSPQWFSYTLRGVGVETWHPRFSYYGFRYVQVEVSAAPDGGSVRVVSLRGKEVHSSSEQVGEFASSDEMLNRIHMLILHAIENNAVSLFTDCPHREKLGWLEQTHLMAPSLLFDFDFAGLYAATARNVADVQKRDGSKAGMVPEIAPQYVVFDPQWDAFNDSPEWGSAAVLASWFAFERTGDREFLAAQYDVMRRYVAYLGTRAHDGIVDYGLGDWFDIGPGDPGVSKLTTAGVTGTAIYYEDLKVLEKTAALIGRGHESAEYARQAEAEKAAFNARFFDAARHIYDKGSQTAQAMPLALGMVPDGERAAVLDALVADIRAHQNHTTSGEVGYHYAVEALLDGGRSDVLLDMLERTDAPSYGYILSQGATSLTEGWDGSHSQDHFMLGSAEEWFYRGLGGINVNLAHESAQQIALRPQVVGKIEWVRTKYDSVVGLIESDWERGASETTYHFTVPANATATIEIESTRPNGATVNGVAAAKAEGVAAEKIKGNRLELRVGSGKYALRAANPAQ
jgi:alpha-L-rhamnosidase